MAVPASQHKRVYDAIVAAVEASTFVPRSYGAAEGGAPPLLVADEDEAVRPETVVCQEVRETTRESRNRRTQQYERDLWLWELYLHFDREVILDDLTGRLRDGGLRIAHDETTGLRQVDVVLRDSMMAHPPQGQPAGGTWVRLQLQANEHRK
jgi:hypothetical protein